MTSEEKRVYLLLKAAIFHFHGLDYAEKLDLDEAAKTGGPRRTQVGHRFY